MGWSTYIEICCVCVITRLKHRDRTHVVTRCFFFSSSTHSLPSIFSSFFFCFVGRERKSRLDPERTFLRFPQCPSVVRIVPIRRERSAITNEFTIFIFFLEKERKEKTHSRFGNFPSSRVQVIIPILRHQPPRVISSSFCSSFAWPQQERKKIKKLRTMGIDCQLDEWLAMKAVYNSNRRVECIFFFQKVL